MIKSDCHMHSYFSGDSDSSMESMVSSAISKGLDCICFTEHLDLDFPKEYGLNFNLDIEKYYNEYNKIKEKYNEQIDIHFGIEIGMVPYLAQRYENILNKYPFDFVICSSHLVDNMDPYYNSFWENKTFKEGCYRYFQTIIENINAYKNFDSYGHLDYISRYGKDINYINYNDYKDIIDEILSLLIKNNKALEINAAGYKYGQNNPNPNFDIIKKYIELGGKMFTIGSDAHKPEHIAYDYNILDELLHKLGIKEYTIFNKRIPKTKLL